MRKFLLSPASATTKHPGPARPSLDLGRPLQAVDSLPPPHPITISPHCDSPNLLKKQLHENPIRQANQFLQQTNLRGKKREMDKET